MGVLIFHKVNEIEETETIKINHDRERIEELGSKTENKFIIIKVFFGLV